jgi:hypothetical protein
MRVEASVVRWREVTGELLGQAPQTDRHTDMLWFVSVQGKGVVFDPSFDHEEWCDCGEPQHSSVFGIHAVHVSCGLGLY